MNQVTDSLYSSPINSSADNSRMKNNESASEESPVLYRRRWLMLFLFSAFSFSNAYQWIHLNIVSDRVSFMWNASLPDSKSSREIAINWLSMVYMLAYIPLIIPAMWFLTHKGLRRTSIIACFLNAVGAWIKCFSVSFDGNRFPLLMTGQTMCAISQIFILGIPAHLAAIWFGANEVSTATSLGVFGNQLGIAFGFVIPPLVLPPISNNTTVEFYLVKFRLLFYSGAAVMTILFVVVCIAFKRRPAKPPSWGQVWLQETVKTDYKKSLKTLLTDVHFLLLVVSYGMNTGCFYSVSTNLNGVLMFYFKNDSKSIGLAGLVLIVSGIVSACVIGFILDKTKQYKRCVFVVYMMSALSMTSFMACLQLQSWSVIFIIITLLGIFMTGYLPLGFEIAAEVTYPENEGLTSGILNLSAQVFGIIFTYVGTIVLEEYGPFYSNLTSVICLFIGTVITAIMKVDLKRQRANLKGSEFEILSSSKGHGRIKQ